MRKTNQITYNIPRGTGFESTSISGFKGLQLSDNPLSVDPNSSLDMKNVYLNDSGSLCTRPRIEYEENIKTKVYDKNFCPEIQSIITEVISKNNIDKNTSLFKVKCSDNNYYLLIEKIENNLYILNKVEKSEFTLGLEFLYSDTYGDVRYIVSGYSGTSNSVYIPDYYDDGIHGVGPVVEILNNGSVFSNSTVNFISLPKFCGWLGANNFQNLSDLTMEVKYIYNTPPIIGAPPTIFSTTFSGTTFNSIYVRTEDKSDYISYWGINISNIETYLKDLDETSYISATIINSFLKNNNIYLLDLQNYYVIKHNDLGYYILPVKDDSYIPVLKVGNINSELLVDAEQKNILSDYGFIKYEWDGNSEINIQNIYDNEYFKTIISSDETDVGLLGSFTKPYNKKMFIWTNDMYQEINFNDNDIIIKPKITLGSLSLGSYTIVSMSDDGKYLVLRNSNGLYRYDVENNILKLIFQENSVLDSENYADLKIPAYSVSGDYDKRFCKISNDGNSILLVMYKKTSGGQYSACVRFIYYNNSNFVDGGLCIPFQDEQSSQEQQLKILVNDTFSECYCNKYIRLLDPTITYESVTTTVNWYRLSNKLKFFTNYGSSTLAYDKTLKLYRGTRVDNIINEELLQFNDDILNYYTVKNIEIDNDGNIYIITNDCLLIISYGNDYYTILKSDLNLADFSQIDLNNKLFYSFTKTYGTSPNYSEYKYAVNLTYFDSSIVNRIVVKEPIPININFSFDNYIKFNNNYWFYGNSNKLWYTNNNDPTYIGEFNYIDVGDSKRVTGLLIISDSILMAFKEDKIFIIQANVLENDIIYTCTEVKGDVGNIPVGQALITKHSEVPLMIDDSGVYTIKQLTNVTLSEHTTQSISFNIDKKFIKELNKDKIITHNYLYWTYLIFPGDTAKVYVLDNRTFEWYYWELPEGNIVSIWNVTENIDGLLYQISQYITKEGNVYSLRTIDKLNQIDFTNSNEYYTSYNDILLEGEVGIEWFWESQILPLNLTKYSKGYSALGYSKVLYETNFLFTDTDADDEFSLKYSFKAYRKMLSDAGTKSTNGTLNYIRSVTQRTYIPRFSFLQVKLENNEFNNDYQTNIPNHNNKLNLIQLKFKYKLMEEIK